VLGWQVSRFGEQPYWPVRAGDDEERGANGALVGRGELHRSPIVTIAVEDIDDALSRVVATAVKCPKGSSRSRGSVGRRTWWTRRETRSGSSSQRAQPPDEWRDPSTSPLLATSNRLSCSRLPSGLQVNALVGECWPRGCLAPNVCAQVSFASSKRTPANDAPTAGTGTPGVVKGLCGKMG